MEPHGPYRPPPPWDAMYDAEPPFDQGTVLPPEQRLDQREFLCNPRDDPQCTRDIAPREPDIVVSFRARLEEKRGTLRGQAGQSAMKGMGEETIEELRALGYVE